MKIKSKSFILKTVAILIITFIIVFLPKEYNTVSLYTKKEATQINYKKVKLSNKEKDIILKYFNEQVFKSNRKHCEYIIAGKYKIKYGKYKLVFDKLDDNCALLNNKLVVMSKEFKKYIIQLSK